MFVNLGVGYMGVRKLEFDWRVFIVCTEEHCATVKRELHLVRLSAARVERGRANPQ